MEVQYKSIFESELNARRVGKRMGEGQVTGYSQDGSNPI